MDVEFHRGTGKFKGIAGSGSCDYRTASSTWECQGEYAIAKLRTSCCIKRKGNLNSFHEKADPCQEDLSGLP